MNEPQKNEQQSDFRSSINLLFLLALAHAYCLLPFMRHSYGINVPGIYGVFALCLILVTFVVTTSAAMLGFLAIWFLAIFCQRVWTLTLHVRGRREHSWYAGSPWLAMLIPFCKSESTARNVEPALCLLIGCALSSFVPVLGMFVSLGALSLGIIRVAQHFAIHRQVTALTDMELEHQALAMRMRQFHQRSF